MKKDIKAIVVGIVTLAALFYFSTMSYKDMNIREHGLIIKAPVVEIYTRRWMTWIDVEIKGQKLDAGSVTTMDNPSLGDSIEVCYILGENCVVQKSMNPKRYYLFFALESLLLIIGIYLIIAGFIGNKTQEKKPFVKITKKERRQKK